MITVKYEDGTIEQREYGLISGAPFIGSARPIPDDAAVTIIDVGVSITAGNEGERSTIIWPWAQITALDLGPIMTDKVRLMEGVPF